MEEKITKKEFVVAMIIVVGLILVCGLAEAVIACGL